MMEVIAVLVDPAVAIIWVAITAVIFASRGV